MWVELLIKETGEIQRQRVYMGDFPFMTEEGTFIINGAERVVVSQLVRSPGVYYTAIEDPATGRNLFNAKVIPNRGAWLEFETAARGQLYVKVDRKRKLEATKLLRAVGYESNDEMSRALLARSTPARSPYITSTLEKDSTNTRGEALIEVYKKLRPGDPPTGDNAEKLVESLFFNFRRYDLGRVGRYKVNKKLSAVADRMGITLPGRADHQPRRHRRDRRPPDRAQQRPGHRRRHRPPRQPPHPRQRRADPERLPRRPAAHGARRPRAHVDPGGREGHARTPSSTSAPSWRR